MNLPALAHTATTPYVFIHDGKAVTNSVAVASYFHKLHKNVIQKVETLDCSPEFASANFSADVQTIEIGNGASRDSKIYEMTKDGFIFLVMGFTGKKAAAFKEAYISEFNRMEAELNTGSKSTKEEAKVHTITLSDEEFCSLCYLWSTADKMRTDARKLYPILVDLGSKYAGRFYDIGYEFNYTLNNAQKALARESMHIENQQRISQNWQRILPYIRDIKH